MSRVQSTRSLVRTLALVALVLALAPAARPAHASDAGQKAAKPHYEKGASEYNLGHFPESIAEFEKAYELDPAPILLFNIAQAHRQNGDNERAAFFYRRYLEQAPNANNRADVEKRIKDLDGVIQQQNDLKRRPPTEVTDAEHAGTGSPAQAVPGASAPPSSAGAIVVETTPPATGTSVVVSPPPTAVAGGTAIEPPGRIRMWVSIGPAFPKFSGRDLVEPTMLSMRAGGGYIFDLGAAGVVDVGGSLSYAPLQYTTIDANAANQGAGFWGLLATGAYRYRVARALEISGELGVGAVWWTGLGNANPFTLDGAGASGPIPMPSLLIGVGAHYHLPRRFVVFAEPTFLFSKTTSDGLTASVSSVSRFDLAFGVGYSMM